jgi:hypothetical protein
VVPSQQPIGHDVASHTHEPLALHSWPCAHAAHMLPAAPHVLLFDVWQAPASLQQPVQPAPPQEQDWLSQDWPVAHVTHFAPPEPHSPGTFPLAHRPLESQQPAAHVAGPQGPPSVAAFVASPDASEITWASAVESSAGPASEASEVAAVESNPVFPSVGPRLASPE